MSLSYGEYLHNKVAKLKKQADAAESDIFKNCSIYITGYTRPSLQDLRRLITSNGGHHVQFFSGPSAATHIVASSLTARKRQQFAHLKVVKPEWIVNSVNSGYLLDWSKYSTITDHTQRTIGSIGSKFGEETTTTEQTNEQTAEQINCLDPKFIEKFYARSRLHHLSTWKSELRAKFLRGIPRSRLSEVRARRNFIMHIDFDSFFVSVALQKHPELAESPVGISNGGAHADIASCNYVARTFGVSNGMWVEKAKSMCPGLVLLPYNFRDYETASTALYQVLNGLDVDVIYPVSVDEAIVDITKLVNSSFVSEDLDGHLDDGQNEEHDEEHTVMQICKNIRAQVRDASGIDASIGVGPNVLAAKLALRDAKPSGQSFFSLETTLEKITDLPVSQLPGVGRKILDKLEQVHISTIGDLRDYGELKLHQLIGKKIGTKLWKYSNGIDDDWDWMVLGHSDPKTVGVDLNWAVRLRNVDEQDHFVTMLVAELLKRFRSTNLSMTSVSVKVLMRHKDAPIDPPKFMGCGLCNATSKTKPINKSELLASTARSMVRDLVKLSGQPVIDVRGIAISLGLAKKAERTMSGLMRRQQKAAAFDASKELAQQLSLNVISDWMKSTELPNLDDVMLMEDYITSSHWTVSSEVVEWMLRTAPNKHWKDLANMFAQKLNDELRKQSACIEFECSTRHCCK